MTKKGTGFQSFWSWKAGAEKDSCLYTMYVLYLEEVTSTETEARVKLR